ncbi:MAG: tRNA pseudouridine(38-40) synthase TruA [Eubacteriales bacterium]|nr:tRNA pseudouridine(38-40) synthase TruA [Eubacteriales bacterium]
MKRIRIRVAYDGTAYTGFQKQGDGTAVQDILEAAVFAATGERVRSLGASRTDAGVHARDNILVFDSRHPIPADRWSYALNCHLPEDIVVFHSEIVAADHHPLRQHYKKTYEYHVTQARFPNPLTARYSWWIREVLDVEVMRCAMKKLIGRHDFEAFRGGTHEYKSTVRTIYTADVSQRGEEIILSVTGDGFLYNMVRIIAGTVIYAGKGKFGPDRIDEMLRTRDRLLSGPTAPACGLVLARIEETDNPDNM